ncbi:hypothetical protein R1sor_015803 [Riccia sorocarpa]|uniref:Endonuclease/exonuclease/phosphatase domain-containing protein n=1 Tax=Riccia sorocarpa TaxID=122646 RepID=A0ABD3HJD7_9MARC
MKISVGSYNVRDLCARTARTKLRQFILNTRPALDILAVQEHKLRDRNLDFITSAIWSQALIFHVPAADGAHAARNPLVTGGKGGVLLMVRASFAPSIVDHGPLPLDGGLWIHFDLPDGRKMGLAALYAPNSVADRTSLWTALEASLDLSRNWILVGDFNMITQQEDQIGGTPELAIGTKKSQWENLLHTLDLRDTFKATDGALRFTWDNRRQAMLLGQEGQDNDQLLDAGRMLKRLDRIYVGSTLHNLISTKILPGSELSDHLPVISVFQLGSPSVFNKTNYRMNTASLQDPKLKAQLATLWVQWQIKYENSNTPALQALRFLGFQFREGLDEEAIFQTVYQKILNRINSPKNKSTTIDSRVIIANQLLYGIIWFVLLLWAANRGKIRALEGLIRRFIRGGDENSKSRHHVAETILHQPKRDGGLGLISLQAQVQAFSAKTIRWAYVPGPHPLKAWLLSQRKGGVLRTIPGSPRRPQGPGRRSLQSWSTFAKAKLLSPLDQLPLPQWQRLSLWDFPQEMDADLQACDPGSKPARLLQTCGSMVGTMAPVHNLGHLDATKRPHLSQCPTFICKIKSSRLEQIAVAM